MKNSYEGRLRDLQRELQTAEKKLEKSAAEVHLNDKPFVKDQLNLTFENQTGALKIVKNLEEEILILQKRIQEYEKSVGKLQKNIKEKDDSLISITKTNHEYRQKITEAVEIVQAALNEKDAALFREKEAKGCQQFKTVLERTLLKFFF